MGEMIRIVVPVATVKAITKAPARAASTKGTTTRATTTRVTTTTRATTIKEVSTVMGASVTTA